ncbi:cytochrome C oxidase subunit II [Bacillaceae bacterium S4-13-58]
MATSKVRGSEHNQEETQVGTIISVGIVAAVIVVMWVAVFGIYMARL